MSISNTFDHVDKVVDIKIIGQLPDVFSPSQSAYVTGTEHIIDGGWRL